MSSSAATPDLPDCMVSMRDGVRLATDVYFARQSSPPTPQPVLLERTPYDKRGTSHADRTRDDPVPVSRPQMARRFTAAGFIYVLQDCRGRYGSEGVFSKYLREAQDGVDTLAWLTQQPWCDGRVGTLGLSYGAHVQSAMACLDPPGLAAMFLDSGGFSSAYHGGIRQGGAYELKQLTWAYKHALLSTESERDPQRRVALEAHDIREWVRPRRWTRGDSPLAAAPEYEQYILEQWDNDVFSPFWEQSGLYARGAYDRYSDAPMVHMSSWYDPYSQTAIDNYVGLKSIKRGPVKLVLGPWTHGQRSVSFAGDVDFGAAAPLDGNLAVDYFSLRRDWCDRYLRAQPVADPLPAPVTLFVMGGGSGRRTIDGRLDHGGRWRCEEDWPLPQTVSTVYYLHASGRMAEQAPRETSAARGYDFDPADPVPTIGGAITSGAPVMQAGAFDQRETPTLFRARAPFRPLAARPDVLVFVTEALDEDIELTGSVLARLYVSSSVVDTDFTIKLIDLYPPNADYPDGYAMNLAHGILRARFRESFRAPQPLQPGVVHEIEIRSFPTSNVFKSGHRIRIDVSSSNFPHFDVNPNVDWRVAGSPAQVARNCVHLDRDHPSQVVLPVILRS